MARQKVFKGKSLNGRELAGFVQQRQARQADSIINRNKRVPKLAIVKMLDDPAIDTYMRLKSRYGQEIGVAVDIHHAESGEIEALILQLNEDEMVDGIIVQLPVAKGVETQKILNLVAPNKDVDGLNADSRFDSATATAILWLLAGYNVELAGKRIVVVGQGRLVGKPTADYLEASGHRVVRCDKSTEDLQNQIEQAEIIITATGQPSLIRSDWIQPGSVVIDAGVAGEQGELRGDVEPKALERTDISITPQKGGLGPLTVCALFENVLKAATTNLVSG